METFAVDVLEIEQEKDRQTWERLVDLSPVPDVYFRPGYVQAYRETDTQSICALVINASGFRCLLPLLKTRPRGSAHETTIVGSSAYSPYGYGGLLPLGVLQRPSAIQVDALWRALQMWCRQNAVICAVVRLHPLFRQEQWFESVNSRDALLLIGNRTLSLDLTSWNESSDCIASLKKGRRSDLNYARRNLRVTWTAGCSAESSTTLQFFQSIYNEHMRAIGAQSFYLFGDDYYSALASGLGDRLAIAIAWWGEQPVGASLFFVDTRYAHYHLSASNQLGYSYKAPTLLLNEGASLARKRGCEQLHLGGGLEDNDTLFRFKESFGGTQFRSATLTIVGDPAAFATIRQMPGARWPFSLHCAPRTEPAPSP